MRAAFLDAFADELEVGEPISAKPPKALLCTFFLFV